MLAKIKMDADGNIIEEGDTDGELERDDDDDAILAELGLGLEKGEKKQLTKEE